MNRSRYSANESTRRLRWNSSETRAQMASSSSPERMVFMYFLLTPYVTSPRALEGLRDYIKSNASTTPVTSAARATSAGATQAGRFNIEAGSSMLDSPASAARRGGMSLIAAPSGSGSLTAMR